MRKIESSFITSPWGSRLPCTEIHATLPRRVTSITAPGMMPSSMFLAVASSIFLSCAEERPTS
jgi:hypothetical protein